MTEKEKRQRKIATVAAIAITALLLILWCFSFSKGLDEGNGRHSDQQEWDNVNADFKKNFDEAKEKIRSTGLMDGTVPSSTPEAATSSEPMTPTSTAPSVQLPAASTSPSFATSTMEKMPIVLPEF